MGVVASLLLLFVSYPSSPHLFSFPPHPPLFWSSSGICVVFQPVATDSPVAPGSSVAMGLSVSISSSVAISSSVSSVATILLPVASPLSGGSLLVYNYLWNLSPPVPGSGSPPLRRLSPPQRAVGLPWTLPWRLVAIRRRRRLTS